MRKQPERYKQYWNPYLFNRHSYDSYAPSILFSSPVSVDLVFFFHNLLFASFLNAQHHANRSFFSEPITSILYIDVCHENHSTSSVMLGLPNLCSIDPFRLFIHQCGSSGDSFRQTGPRKKGPCELQQTLGNHRTI